MELYNNPVHCKCCGKQYKLATSLYNHTKYECGKEPQFHCPMCSYRSYQKGNFRRHLKVQHNVDSPKNTYQALK